MHERRVRREGLPRHVAIIMDGNGRWAQARGLDRLEGHRAGIESVRAVVRAAHELGIELVTLYSFSTENWNRPRREVDELMRLLETYLDSEIDEVHRNGIRVRAMGRLERLPESVQRKLEGAVQLTRSNREMQLVFALSYGGRTEIADAVRQLARDVERGAIESKQVDEQAFAQYLYLPDVPDPDLLIRTGGDQRISNFLLWQIAYAELYLTDVQWPDFRKGTLVDAVLAYQARERRYGKTSAQIRGDAS